MSKACCGVHIVLGPSRVWNKADGAGDHKHSSSCEIPSSIGAFFFPDPSGAQTSRVFAEKETELEKSSHDEMSVAAEWAAGSMFTVDK